MSLSVATVDRVLNNRLPVREVCNELTPETRAGLIDGVIDVVIATSTAELAAKAVEAMAKAVEALAQPPAQILLPFDLFISENI